jgi:hypothetical protein
MHNERFESARSARPTRNGEAPLLAAQPRLGDTGGVPREIGLVPLEPYGGRLVAYLERRTPWDS